PADLRNPQEGLRVALEADAASGHENAAILDTLAFAYHMNARHAEAVETERMALSLLPRNESSTRAEFEGRLAKFEAALRKR
ncbi:MAG TPA: hypothetical protein VKD72_03530, partial [Gemmataceae bacterium]|nr:hypothetical protein [Gemmataceae bacterium]